ncbi:hypothetical protein ACVMHW_007902 [Bradyrhizobium diazoefficiens]
MAHVGIHGFAPGDREEGCAEDREGDVKILVDQEFDGVERAERRQHGRRLDDAVDAERGEHGEPGQHHRSEDAADEAGALFLHHEQADQDDDGDGHDGWRERGRVHLEAFDGAQHGDRRRDRAVTVEQGGADEADHQQMRAPGAGLGVAGVEQGQQGDDAAFAAVVRAQDQERIFQRDDQQQRPEDQRGNPQDSVGGHCRAVGGRLGGFLQGVERAGADIAIDHPEGAHGHCKRQWIRMMAGSDCGRTGQWRPLDGFAPGGAFRRARASRSLRRDVANIHGVYLWGLSCRRSRRLT